MKELTLYEFWDEISNICNGTKIESIVFRTHAGSVFHVGEVSEANGECVVTLVSP